MCGIFGYLGQNEQAASIVLEGLKKLEYRGYDSWGVAVVANGKLGEERKIQVKKKVGKIGGATVTELPSGTMAIGHTRWATHGGVSDLNAHPHLDCSHSIAIVHNGIVENYQQLKDELIANGHVFISETDTEVIAHLIEESRKSLSFAEAVEKTFLRLNGANAIVAMHADERTLVVIRQGSPIVIGKNESQSFVASDPAALVEHTKKVMFLEDGEMAILREGHVTRKNIFSQKTIPVEWQTLEWDAQQTQLGAWQHFMLKEIHEQPKVLTELLEKTTIQVSHLAESIHKAKRLFLIGCGSSAHEAIAGTYFFEHIAQFYAMWSVGSEFGRLTKLLEKNDMLIALSQSGETMDILEPLKAAQKSSIHIAALVNVIGSSLYRLADEKILIGAGPERAVASTKAVTAKLALLLLVAFAMAGDQKRGAEAIKLAIRGIEKLLAPASRQVIAALAHTIKDQRQLLVIGRGISYPLALETALKVKEISYIHAEGFAAGELKHGALALVEKGTPCIAFLPNDESYDAMVSSAMEMKARGGYLIGVSFKPHAAFDTFIEMSDAGEASILVGAVFGQLLAYELAIVKGLDPDMPRNLAKSVTVK
jgi:glutamine---fructose-6-phosphate transaminase (isomerizing)